MASTRTETDWKTELDEVYRDFRAAVNMPPAELAHWLESDASKSVGWADGERKTEAAGKESVGHASGRRIVKLLRTKKAGLTQRDLAHMKKVVGYVHRHRAQGPDDPADVRDSRWRHSLMNWGHDPLRG